MKTRLFAGCLWLAAVACTCAAEPAAEMLVVVGAGGTDDYQRQFNEWAGRWRAAAMRAGVACETIGLGPTGESSDLELLTRRLKPLSTESPHPFWLILIGHGTFDGKHARFNLRGPDFTAADLAASLKTSARPLAIVNCASASGPFLSELSGPHRIVLTATKSGYEYNFAHFGDYLSSAIDDPQADLDKDEQTSLLEAFLLASARVRELYAGDGRLATEHALLDDNGDRQGTPADWFQGVRVVKTAQGGASPDGQRAGRLCLVSGDPEERLLPAARARRDSIEAELSALRQRKRDLPETEYLDILEPLLVELARIYQGTE
ncbi:MAG: hypothetical protein ACT4QC_08005 [Planctomycetaceae bacterium]